MQEQVMERFHRTAHAAVVLEPRTLSPRDRVAAINRDTERLKQLRADMIEELAGLPLREDPEEYCRSCGRDIAHGEHARDCRTRLNPEGE